MNFLIIFLTGTNDVTRNNSQSDLKNAESSQFSNSNQVSVVGLIYIVCLEPRPKRGFGSGR